MLPKAVTWIAESLNEYADFISTNEPVPNHTPSSPEFWFDGLARETANGWKIPEAAALLNDNARSRLQALGVTVGA